MRLYSVLSVHGTGLRGAVVKPFSTGCIGKKKKSQKQKLRVTLLKVHYWEFCANYVHYHQCPAISIGNHVLLLLWVKIINSKKVESWSKLMYSCDKIVMRTESSLQDKQKSVLFYCLIKSNHSKGWNSLNWNIRKKGGASLHKANTSLIPWNCVSQKEKLSALKETSLI